MLRKKFKLLLLLTMLLKTAVGICQEIKVPLQSKNWDYAFKSFISFNTKSFTNSNHVDSPYILKDGSILPYYKEIKSTIQYDSTGNVAAYLNILLGLSTNDEVVIVIDNNYNDDFADDPVNKFQLDSTIKNKTDLFLKLPTVVVDSIKIVDKENKIRYRSIQLKLAPSTPNPGGLIDKSTFLTQDFLIGFYVLDYYSGTFEINTHSYEIAIVPHPLVFNFYSYPDLKFNDTNTSFLIYKNGIVKDSLLFSTSAVLRALRNKEHTFTVEDKYLTVKKVETDSNYVLIEIKNDKPLTEASIVEDNYNNDNHVFTSFSVLKRMITEIDIRSNKYTIIEFSGSWCVPCQMILPKVKELVTTLPANIKFITVAVEDEEKKAIQYFDTHKPQWEFIYENFDCPNDRSCFRKIFNVGAFPTFVIINNAGKVVFKEAGSESIELLKKKISTLN